MSNIGSLLLYFISFIIAYLLYKKYNKCGKKIYLLLSVAIPILLGSLRYNVGTDYLNYKMLYDNGAYIDPGFYIVSTISRHIGGFTTLIFIYCFLTVLFFTLAINGLERDTRPIAFLVMLLIFIPLSFNGMRQILAVSIIFYAIKYLRNNNHRRFIIFTLIATLFHATAIVAIILYINKRTNNIFGKIILSILILVASIKAEEFIGIISNNGTFSHYMLYSNYTSGYSFNNLTFVMYLFELFLYIVNVNKIKKYNNQDYLFIFFICLITSITGFFNPDIKRIGHYFAIARIPLLSSICESKTPKQRFAARTIVVLYVMLSFTLAYYILGQSKIIPYITLWGAA